MSFISQFGVTAQNNEVLFQKLSGYSSEDAIISHLKDDADALAFVIAHLPEASKQNVSLVKKLVNIAPNNETIKQIASAIIGQPDVLKEKIEERLAAFNQESRPNQVKLQEDLVTILVDVIKEKGSSDSPMRSFENILREQKGVRLGDVKDKVYDRAFKEALQGNFTLANLLDKSYSKINLSESDIEKHFTHAIALFKMFPNANKEVLRGVMGKLKGEYLQKVAQVLAEGLPPPELNQKLQMLKELLPEDFKHLKEDCTRLIANLKDTQLEPLAGSLVNTHPDHSGVLRSLSTFVQFLGSPEASQEEFLFNLLPVNDDLKIDFSQKGESDILFGALMSCTAEAFAKAVLKAEQSGSNAVHQFDNLNELRQVIQEIGGKLGREVDIEVEMQTGDDVMMTNLMRLIPGTEYQQVRDALTEVENKVMFEGWLAGQDEEQIRENYTTFAEMVAAYKETGFDEF